MKLPTPWPAIITDTTFIIRRDVVELPPPPPPPPAKPRLLARRGGGDNPSGEEEGEGRVFVPVDNNSSDNNNEHLKLTNDERNLPVVSELDDDAFVRSAAANVTNNDRQKVAVQRRRSWRRETVYKGCNGLFYPLRSSSSFSSSSSSLFSSGRFPSSPGSFSVFLLLLIVLLLDTLEARVVLEPSTTPTTTVQHKECHSVQPAPKWIHYSTPPPPLPLLPKPSAGLAENNRRRHHDHRSAATVSGPPSQCRYFVSAPSLHHVVRLRLTSLWGGLRRRGAGRGAAAQGGEACNLPTLSIVEVMPSGRERLMETFCSSIGNGGGDSNADSNADIREALPLVFQSSAQSVIITYNWDPGDSNGGNDGDSNVDTGKDAGAGDGNQEDGILNKDLGDSNLDVGDGNVGVGDSNVDVGDGNDGEGDDRAVTRAEGFSCSVTFPRRPHPECAFQCGGSERGSERGEEPPLCLPVSNLVCNEREDCADGSDEWGCFYTLSPLSTPHTGNLSSNLKKKNEPLQPTSDTSTSYSPSNNKGSGRGAGAGGISLSATDDSILAVILVIAAVLLLVVGVMVYLLTCRGGGGGGGGGAGLGGAGGGGSSSGGYREHRTGSGGGSGNFSDSYLHPGGHSSSSNEVVYVPSSSQSPLEALAEQEARRVYERGLLLRSAHHADALNLPPAIPMSGDGEEGYCRLHPTPTSLSSPSDSQTVLLAPPNRTVFDSEDSMDSSGWSGGGARSGHHHHSHHHSHHHHHTPHQYHQQQQQQPHSSSSSSSSNKYRSASSSSGSYRSPRTSSSASTSGALRSSSCSSGGHKSPSTTDLLLCSAANTAMTDSVFIPPPPAAAAAEVNGNDV